MTDTHFSWFLSPSVLYKRLCKVLWGLFLFAALSYASNGYELAALVIVSIATLGYLNVAKHHVFSTIQFHAGNWQVGNHHLKNLQWLRAVPFGFIIYGEVYATQKKKHFIVFCDQLSKHKEHQLRWVMKQMACS